MRMFSAMDNGNKTSLERAFELAKSGKFETIGDLRNALGREGYNAGQVDGPALRTQLRELILAARKKPDAQRLLEE